MRQLTSHAVLQMISRLRIELMMALDRVTELECQGNAVRWGQGGLLEASVQGDGLHVTCWVSSCYDRCARGPGRVASQVVFPAWETLP